MDTARIPDDAVSPISPQRHTHKRLDGTNSQEVASTPIPSVSIEPADSQIRNNGYAPLHDVDISYQPHTSAPGIQGPECFPSSTNSDGSSVRSLPRPYSHRASRKENLMTGMNRLGLTFLLCLLIGLSLRAFEGFDDIHPRILNRSEAKTFNAVMLGLSLGLGMNLASSLKHYVVILRWSILTQRYVSLQTFDLILGCENLSKVFKLMVMSFPGIERVPHRKYLPLWLKARKGDASRHTWLICFVWLLINVGAQILVATLSIFWPVNPSDTMPLLTRGNVSVANLETWQAGDRPLALSAANAYGIAGSQYEVYNESQPKQDIAKTGISIQRGSGYYEYTFLNRNPDALYSDYVASSRTVRSHATCKQFTFGNAAGRKVEGFVHGTLDGWKTAEAYPILHVVGGQTSWTGMLNSTCGPRCISVIVHQSANNKTIAHNSMFMCNSTVDPIEGDPGEYDFEDEERARLYSTDEFARIAAGSIAWSGYFEERLHNFQSKLYLTGLPFTPHDMATKEEIEDILARFSIGAIAAFDDHRPQPMYLESRRRPEQGQRLQVDWPRIFIILGWVLVLQFSAFMALLSFANKSIIRDESFFSMALLLSPAINKISKDEGINYSGEEIFTHPSLWSHRIKYNYRKTTIVDVKAPKGVRKVKKVDILFEGEDPVKDLKKRTTWADGEYI